MITVVSLVLWATVAAAFWWLAQRQSLLLNYAEKLLRDAAKDRHPSGSRIQPEPEELHELDEVAREFGVDLDEPEPAEPVAEWQPDPDPATDPVGMPPIRRPQPGPATEPAAAAIDAEWSAKQQQILGEWRAKLAAIEAGT